MTARKPTNPREAKEAQAAEARAKGSVQEAIGKLIGDDAVEQSGKDQQAAAAAQTKAPPRS